MEEPYLIKQFVETVGFYTETAIRNKISEGVWLNGREYIKAPDGHIYIIKSGVLKWIYSSMPTLHPGMKHLDN